MSTQNRNFPLCNLSGEQSESKAKGARVELFSTTETVGLINELKGSASHCICQKSPSDNFGQGDEEQFDADHRLHEVAILIWRIATPRAPSPHAI